MRLCFAFFWVLMNLVGLRVTETSGHTVMTCKCRICL